jgi:putative DNA primase/helicase
VKALLHPAEAPPWLLELIKAESNRVHNAIAVAGEKWLPGQRNNRLTSLGGTMRKRGMSRESIAAALLVENQERCDPPLPHAEVIGIAESVARYNPDEVTQPRVTPVEVFGAWPDPLPIQAELPPVEAFDPGLLPKSLRILVQDISERMQAPPDFAAAASIVGLAGAVGRRAVIQPKARDTAWVVTPNLWGGVIARPGFMKTPTIQAIMQPLHKIQKARFDEHGAAVSEYERQKENHTLEYAVWKEQFKRASKSGDSRPDRPADLPAPPTPERLLVGDATFEKLHEVMESNPAGVLVLRDELTGWLAQLDRPGRELERAFSLEAWNGDGAFTVDRMGRGMVHVEHVCMSLFGGIQPGRLRGYLSEALRDGPGNDGLIQRFQVLVWPDLPADWELVDRVPDQAALVQAADVFARLVKLSVEPRRVLRFAPDAQELFFEWYADLQHRVRNGPLHPAMASHLSKYASLMPALAL